MSTDGSVAWVRRIARTILPARLYERARALFRRRFYRSVSMVSREPRIVVWFRRVVLRRKPVLYHFEVHITDHCNLNCKGCAHFSNLCPPTFADLAEYEADMKTMARMFSKVHQIYILGGEPLLHPEVASFIRASREAFPETRLYLMTNGTLVMRMNDDFWEALASTRVILLCDSYPIGLPVEQIEAKAREYGAIVEWTEQREQFFKIPIDPAGGHDVVESFGKCQGYNNCPIIRDGKLYPCAYVAFADVFKARFGLEGLEVTERDFISFRDEEDSEKIMRFLTNPVPWCANCDMDSRFFYEWGRSKRTADEWIKPPAETDQVAS